jgi:hypothetical protein
MGHLLFCTLLFHILTLILVGHIGHTVVVDDVAFAFLQKSKNIFDGIT